MSIAVAQATSYLNVFRHAVELFGDDAAKALAEELDTLLNAEELDNAAIMVKCGPAAKAMDALAKVLAAKGDFSKEQCKQLWVKVTTDEQVLPNLDEYGAEQVAGALVALHSSFTVGAGPRGKAGMKVPEELEALSVRPTVYEPEDMFDAGEEEDEFNLDKWLKRLEAAKALVK